jgi:hypothetical protein
MQKKRELSRLKRARKRRKRGKMKMRMKKMMNNLVLKQFFLVYKAFNPLYTTHSL